MKKIFEHLNRFPAKVVVLLFIASFMAINCSAYPKDDIQSFFESQKDNGYGKVINDSIASIMFNAKSIICELQSKNPVDSLRKDTITRVPAKMHPVVLFLFFNSSNFKSDETVYGKFDSWACYKFEAKKKKTVYLELDFGLRKLRLLDADKKLLCAQDMKGSSVQFLQLTRLLFPEDMTLELLFDNLTSKQK